MKNKDNTSIVYRAIYQDEIEDFSNLSALAQKTHMKKSFCEENYQGKNTLNYDKILQTNGIDNPEESFLFLFKDQKIAEEYAKGLSNNLRGDAVVCAFKFDEQTLENCKGFGTYENFDPKKNDEVVEEYAIPLSMYDPTKNFIGPLNQPQAYSYNPDDYSEYTFM